MRWRRARKVDEMLTQDQARYLREALESIGDRQVNALLPEFDATIDALRWRKQSEEPATEADTVIRWTDRSLPEVCTVTGYAVTKYDKWRPL
jgi:hypothetical protein